LRGLHQGSRRGEHRVDIALQSSSLRELRPASTLAAELRCQLLQDGRAVEREIWRTRDDNRRRRWGA
jgi:hypothetical protein